jgi:hypothetical protein
MIIYNCFNRWSRRRFWLKLLEALVASGAVTRSTAVDSTYLKARRAAFGGKGAKAPDVAIPRADQPHNGTAAASMVKRNDCLLAGLKAQGIVARDAAPRSRNNRNRARRCA